MDGKHVMIAVRLPFGGIEKMTVGVACLDRGQFGFTIFD
jgi:succinate-acetate transporter protein